MTLRSSFSPLMLAALLSLPTLALTARAQTTATAPASMPATAEPATNAAATAPAEATSSPTTAPTTAPAATEPVKADYSTPKATMNTINQALDASNFTILRQSFDVSPAQRRGFDALLNTIESAHVFEEAFIQKFGVAKAKEIGINTGLGGALASRTDAVAKASVQINGDDATMEMPTTPGNPPAELEFHHVNDQWKLAASSLVRSESPEFQRVLPLVEKMSQAYRDAAADVKSDNVNTPEQAQQALLKRIVPLQVEAEHAAAVAASQPASQSDTQSATQSDEK